MRRGEAWRAEVEVIGQMINRGVAFGIAQWHALQSQLISSHEQLMVQYFGVATAATFVVLIQKPSSSRRHERRRQLSP
jgi:hypothetical protein